MVGCKPKAISRSLLSYWTEFELFVYVLFLAALLLVLAGAGVAFWYVRIRSPPTAAKRPLPMLPVDTRNGSQAVNMANRAPAPLPGKQNVAQRATPSSTNDRVPTHRPLPKLPVGFCVILVKKTKVEVLCKDTLYSNV